VEIKVLEANCTTSNKSLDGLLQTTPIEEFLDSAVGNGETGMAAQGTIMKCRDDALLQLNIVTDPDTSRIADNAIVQSKLWPGLRIDGQFRQELLGLRISVIPGYQFSEPSRSRCRDSLQLGRRVWMTGKRISSRIGSPGLLYDPVLQTSQHMVHFQLPLGM